MAGFAGEIIERRSDAVLVRVDANECDAGCSCNCRKVTTISLPPVRGRKLNISMRPGDQCVLLVNTLIIPLCGFVAGASLAQWISANDLLAFAGAILGLGIGVVVCRRHSFDRVVIEEVSNE